MNDSDLFRIDNVKLNILFKDIEDIFWFFFLSHASLCDPDIQNIIRSKDDPNNIIMLDRYCENVKYKTNINNGKYESNANILSQIILLGKLMAIMMYDYILLSKYFNVLNELEEFKFLKFIRNGAAHNNKFNMKDEDGNWKLEEKEAVKFNNKSITRLCHRKKVFNDFVSYVDMFVLVKLFSDKIDEIENKKIK